MALLAPYQKFITDINDAIKNLNNRSITIGDIRADIVISSNAIHEMNIDDDAGTEILSDVKMHSSDSTEILSDAKIPDANNISIKVYYIDPRERIINNDEKFLPNIVRNLKVGRVTVFGDVVTDTEIRYDSGEAIIWQKAGGELYEFPSDPTVQTFPNGNIAYYYSNGFGTILASPRDPHVYSASISSAVGLKVEDIMRIMRLFVDSTHPDINILQRKEMKKMF